MQASSASDERLRRIEAVTDAALARLEFEDLLNELLDRVRELVQADTAAVLLLETSAQQLVVAAARGVEEEQARRGTRVPFGKGFAGRVAAEKRPVTIEHVDRTSLINPLLWQRGVRSLLGVPMLNGGTVAGVLHVGTLTPRQFSDDDVYLLELAADRVALAAQAHLSGADRAAAVALHRSLLPPQLSAPSGLELAARYVTGSGGVGGDWYDVFTLPCGRLGIAIGDVVGRGLQAAVVMGRLRSALRAYALDEDDPAGVLRRLDRNVQHFEPEIMATVAYAMIDPSQDRLWLSVAGHPPPVLAFPGQPAAMVDVPGDLPLGVQHDYPRRANTVELPPGALMCFYTDGLVERRGSSLDVGFERLCETVVAEKPETACTAVMEKLVGTDSVNDDIALLALQRQDSTEV